MTEELLVTRTQRVAKCVSCGSPFHFVQISFVLENDRGYWEVVCKKCGRRFFVRVLNPLESYPRHGYRVHERMEGAYEGDPAKIASESVIHNLDLEKRVWTFDYSSGPLYVCASGLNLEQRAIQELEAARSEVDQAWIAAEPAALKIPWASDAILVRLPVPCDCGREHIATFYASANLGAAENDLLTERCLLADVSNADYEDCLDGIKTKASIMTQLEKLVIRWQLIADQIVLAAPFVGHQHMSATKQLEVWRWLASILDPKKAILITRPQTWNSYKKALAAEGGDVSILESFGLIGDFVQSGLKKHDFHAKFFAGLVGGECEVFSGSANLLPGNSVENTSFDVAP